MIKLITRYWQILVVTGQKSRATNLTGSPVPIQRDRKSLIQSFTFGSSNVEYRFHLRGSIIIPLFYTIERIRPALNIWVNPIAGHGLAWCARVRNFRGTAKKNAQRSRHEIYCIVSIRIEIGLGWRYKCLRSFLVTHINWSPIVERYDRFLFRYETAADIWLNSELWTKTFYWKGGLVPIRAKHQKSACSSFPEKPLIPAAWIRYAQPSKWRRHSLGLPIIG